MTRKLAWTVWLAAFGLATAVPARTASQAQPPAAPAAGAQPPAPAAGAQPAAPDAELAPPRPAISLLLVNEPTVTVTYNGDYGLMRVTGVLVEAPPQPLRVVSADYGTRVINWNEVFSLNVVRVPTAELPVGSFTVTLSNEEGSLPRTTITANDYNVQPTVALVPAAPAHVVELPRGDLVLEGQPYHALRIPTDRVTDIRMEPIRGSVETMPDATISMQVTRAANESGGSRAGEGKGEESGRHDRPPRDRQKNGRQESGATPGKTVEVPLRTVESYRRDVRRQLLSVTRGDGQIFSGHPVQIPNVQLVVDLGGTPPTLRSYPLTNIAQFETTINLLNRSASSPAP